MFHNQFKSTVLTLIASHLYIGKRPLPYTISITSHIHTRVAPRRSETAHVCDDNAARGAAMHVSILSPLVFCPLLGRTRGADGEAAPPTGHRSAGRHPPRVPHSAAIPSPSWSSFSPIFPALRAKTTLPLFYGFHRGSHVFVPHDVRLSVISSVGRCHVAD